MEIDCKDGIVDRTSPAFPGYPRPTIVECEQLHAILTKLHGERVQVPYQPGEHPDLLDSMVKTILSQNTTDTNSSAAFLKLKARFPVWEKVRTSPVMELEDTIRSAGLAQTKSKRIKAILETLHDEKGECSMEYLRTLSNEAIKKELSRFNGVGPKTISCMLLFNMQRPDLAVDTHIFRLAQRAGWVPTEADVKRFNKAAGVPSPSKRRGKRKSDGTTPVPSSFRQSPDPSTPISQWQKLSRESVYEHLNASVPDGLKYGLHLLIIAHGKATCRSRACDGSSLSPCPVCLLGGKTYAPSRPKQKLAKEETVETDERRESSET